jgi:CDP-diacylglycerol--glycerol-3-phosphate 3-phosphatidyltransferase
MAVATNLRAHASVVRPENLWPPLASWPNFVTGLRTVAAVVLGAAALAESSAILLVTAFATYWVGDVFDGWLARRLDQETRVGAVLDVIGDRASCAVLCAGLIVLQPQLWPAVAIFLVQFMVVDCVASLSFLHWPLLSYNYFDRVDRQVWLLNWSKPAKFLNTVSVVAVAVAGAPLLALAVAAAQLVLKAWTAQRIWQLLQTAGSHQPG